MTKPSTSRPADGDAQCGVATASGVARRRRRGRRRVRCRRRFGCRRWHYFSRSGFRVLMKQWRRSSAGVTSAPALFNDGLSFCAVRVCLHHNAALLEQFLLRALAAATPRCQDRSNALGRICVRTMRRHRPSAPQEQRKRPEASQVD